MNTQYKFSVPFISIFTFVLYMSCSTVQTPGQFSKIQALKETLEASDQYVLSAYPGQVEKAVKNILSGGKLWVAGNAGVVGELSYRSGGMMMIRRLRNERVSKFDVVLFFPTGPEDQLSELNHSGLVISIGKHDLSSGRLPLIMTQVILGQMFLNEMIAGFTRQGKMPVIFETIGRYDGHPRIHKYKSGEIPFHQDMKVAPIAFGILSKKYKESLFTTLDEVIEQEGKKLILARKMVKVTRPARILLYYGGHLYPWYFETQAPKDWRKINYIAGFTNMSLPEENFTSDDLVIYIGAHHSPVNLIKKVVEADAKAIYLCLHQDRKLKNLNEAKYVWIDPQWEWQEASSRIDDYDVPVAAISGLVNTIIFEEIAGSKN